VNRLLIYEAAGQNARQRVADRLDRLEAEYLKSYKRKIPGEILHISCWGDVKIPTFGLVAYHEPVHQPIIDQIQLVLSSLQS
jgi:hypothetical protein